MKKIKNYIFFTALLICNGISAQVLKTPAGKKILVTTESASTMVTTVMGQDMEVESKNTSETETEFIKVTANGYTMRRTLKRIRIFASGMGNEQTIDSDKDADKNNTAYSEVFAKLNKTVDVEIENNKLKNRSNDQEKASMNNLTQGFTEVTSLSLHGMDLSKLVPGHTWNDSTTVIDGFLINTKYTVNKVDDNGIEIVSVSKVQINTSISQAGMDGTASFTGSGTATRLYNKATGILIKEEADNSFSGTIEIMGMSMPVSFKDKSTITVK